MDRNPQLAVMIMLAMGLWTFIALTGLVYALRTRRRGLARLAGAALIGAVLLYVGTVVAVSAESHEVVLPNGKPLRFCGFYLDCHMGAAVDGVTVTEALGEGADRVEARGRFHVVTVEMSSNAARARMNPADLDIRVVDDAGGSYRRSPAAERALLGSAYRSYPFDEILGPGESYTRQIVFDLPQGVLNPRLQISDGFLPDRVIEFLLIGDDDSLLHPKTRFAL